MQSLASSKLAPEICDEQEGVESEQCLDASSQQELGSDGEREAVESDG